MNNNTKYQDDFLTLLERPLDPAQESALKVQRNAVIAAGAGSGKTQVLATRYAWLILTAQAKVDEILTLTFTNKAASEMYQRIYQTLNFFANHEKDSNLTDENIKLAKEALNNFSSAHIQTLDSYSSGIVRQCANRYGIKPDFTTGSGDTSRDIKNKAFQFVLKNRNNPCIKEFADPGKLQDFAEETLGATIEKYTSLSTENNFFQNKLEEQLNEIIDAWNYYALGYIPQSDFEYTENIKSLKTYVSEIMSELDCSKSQDDPKKAIYVQAINKLIDKSALVFDLQKITKEDIVTNSPNLEKSIFTVYDFINEAKLTTKLSDKIGSVNSKVSPIVRQKNSLISILKPISDFIKEFPNMKELNILFDEFLQEINSSKRTSGNLSFNDVTTMALKVLLENEDIRNQEKNTFKKIMIDEFQDNNGNNRDLLYLLALKENEFESKNPGENYVISVDKIPLRDQIIIRKDNKIIEDKRSYNKLFFVGDEKQSIYKFRGAEVSVFNELTKDDENALYSMTYNYRSSPELIQAFNTFFKGGNKIFESGTEKKDYEAYYLNNALKNGETLPVLTKENVPIHCAILEKDKFSELQNDLDLIPEKEQLAYFLSKKIYKLKQNNVNLKNIAILCRSRTDYKIITKYLNLNNINYEVDQFNNIFEDGIINDFYNFFRLCVYPSDINSYGVYLTCPLCGLSVNSLEIILSYLKEYEKENDDVFDPFPDDENLEKKIAGDLGKEDFEKYLNGKNYFIKSKKLVLQGQIAPLIWELWHKRGYKYESFLTPQTQLSSEHFDMIFELAREADSQGKNISWFVDQLELLKKTYNSDSADIDAKGISYPLERTEAVQIMTIHKSKGLQFEHVFLWGCVAPRPRSMDSRIFFQEDIGMTIKPESGGKNYFYEKGTELRKAKEVAEYRRLIYVGITRAIKDVYIIGAFNPNPKSSSTALLHLIEDAIMEFYPEVSMENSFNENAGFDFIEIEPVSYSVVHNTTIKSSLDSIREIVIEKAEKVFTNSKIINFKSTPIERIKPSSLELNNFNHNQEDKDTGEKYEEPADILISSDFLPKDFGTLVHAYLEAQANNIPLDEFKANRSMFKRLSEKEILEKTKECIKMAEKFKESDLGQKFEKAKNQKYFFRAEWGFRMFLEGKIYTGSIDLIFYNGDGTYTLVDYKSDTEINPENYKGQQFCYRTAASRLLKVDENKISLYLYYLKYDKTVKLA